MGCDIHTHVEYQNREGEWICGDLFKLNIYFSGNCPYESDPYSCVEICGSRNYSLFSVLANVRNYDDIPYISDPKGIPDDVCAIVEKDYKSWGEDAHSASFFTLKELLDWNKIIEPVKYAGFVSPDDAKKLDDGQGTPNEWCQWTSNPTWVKRKWESDYRPLDELIEELIRRGKDLGLWRNKNDAIENADKIRIIFWFDN